MLETTEGDPPSFGIARSVAVGPTPADVAMTSEVAVGAIPGAPEKLVDASSVRSTVGGSPG
jgi:hypothetical protein